MQTRWNEWMLKASADQTRKFLLLLLLLLLLLDEAKFWPAYHKLESFNVPGCSNLRCVI